jgi:hypothetical protein
MAIYIDPATAAKVVTSALTVAKQSGAIQRHIQRLHFLVKHGRLRGTIFGVGGVGKSTLGKFLASRPGVQLLPSAYSESADVELFDLPVEAAEVGAYRAAPGQPVRRQAHWPDLQALLVKGETRVVVNVVAFGYHSFGLIGYRDSQYYRPGMKEADFVREYTASKRREELDALRELVPQLKIADGRLRMMTLVTKQDLWWKRRVAVDRYYREKEYGTLIEEVRAARGARHFQHEFASTALVISNFSSGTGEVLAENVGGYNTPIQLAHLDMVLRILKGFARGPRR